MPDTIPESELLRFLSDIEAGRIDLKPEDEPQGVYAGNVRYTASNGWRMVVFSDANEWDYIEAVEAPDGRTLDFSDIEDMPTAGRYTPRGDISWSKYGIPGYMKFRCKVCGAGLTEGPPWHPSFQCRACRYKGQ